MDINNSLIEWLVFGALLLSALLHLSRMISIIKGVQDREEEERKRIEALDRAKKILDESRPPR